MMEPCNYGLCSCKETGGLLSIFKNRKCKCGNFMNREISLEKGIMINHEGFAQDMSTFIIFDDLKVMPDNIQNCLSLPINFGYEDFYAIKAVTVVNVTQKEMVGLLKCSLLSETPLTDFFLRKKQFPENATLRSALFLNIGFPEDNVSEEMIKLKVMVRKSNRKILFALAEEDFVDFLFSFLTFPLGGVEHMLKGNSCLGSIDNLYKSVVDLDQRYMKSSDLKEKLVKARLAQQFKLQKQILPIDEVPISNYSCYTMYGINKIIRFNLTAAQGYVGQYQGGTVYAPLSYLDPLSSGFVKSLSLYMVTDDLVVTPTSSISVVSFLTMSGFSPSDLEERVVSIGKKECLNLLKASLISSSALTDGLGQFINPIKEEKISN